MMYGFTFYFNGKDYFVETKQVKKTNNLAVKVLKLMGFKETEGNVKTMLQMLQKAQCEIRTLSNGVGYYNIFGENFGGRGSFMDDGNTVFLYL